LALQQVAVGENATPGTVPPEFMSCTNQPLTRHDYKPPTALKWIMPPATCKAGTLQSRSKSSNKQVNPEDHLPAAA
jgi:hypothetical protein